MNSCEHDDYRTSRSSISEDGLRRMVWCSECGSLLTDDLIPMSKILDIMEKAITKKKESKKT